MTGFALSERSLSKLVGVHADLVAVVHRAIQLTGVDFVVLEGLRTKERQAELLAAGATRTMNSRHLTGHAVDLGAVVGGKVRWDNPLYEYIGTAMSHAAAELGIPITWGNSWVHFRDMPHFELPWAHYPIGG